MQQILDWLYENRAWLFEGIGVVILAAVVTWLLRLARRGRQETPARSGEQPAAGVDLQDVTVKRKATIGGVTAPERGVVIGDSKFGELEIKDVGVRPPAAAAAEQAAAPIIGNQLTDVEAQTISLISHIHLPDDGSRIAAAELRRAYLSSVLDQADQLPLAGVDRQTAGNAEAHLHLSAVYTALLTQALAPSEADLRSGNKRAAIGAGGEDFERQRRLSAVEQLNRHDRLVLLGGPGSGKSTFVSFVALCLAGALLDEPQLNLELLTAPLPADDAQRQPWDHGPLLPLRVVLRDFAARGLPPAGQPATVEHLWRFVEGELAAGGLAQFVPHLRKELLERGGLLLFDGLDEVPEADERRVQIKQVVSAFAAAHRRCRILVTSRTYAYQNQDWRLPGFAEAVLEPFTPQQIRAFIDRWYEHIAVVRHRNPEDMQGRAEVLKQRVFVNNRLYALAEQPLLLTLMASLHAWRGGNLPERRYELYKDAVDLLLDWWENQRVVRGEHGETVVIQRSLEEFLKIKDRGQLMKELYCLAFKAHKQQPQLTGTADIAQDDLVAALLKISSAEVKPKLLIEYLSNRAGLLAPRGNGVYTLPHRTFQEYLAACHLTDDDFPDQLAELARNDPQRWREVVLLAAAKAASGAASTLWSLADALCFLAPDDAAYAPADDWGALLAGQALVEAADLGHVHRRNQPRLQQVRSVLLHALGGDVLPAVDRALAGQALAKLGDGRIEVLDPLRMEFCFVPAGPFIMGEGGKQRQYPVPYDYWIGRYPVTVAQFAVFTAAGGYAESGYWVEAAQAGFWQRGKFDGRDRPRQVSEPFDLANHPVAGFSWYEALAFVRWLDAVSAKPAGFALRLPNEPEWEKAARGGLGVITEKVIQPLTAISAAPQVSVCANPLRQRKYPWGEEPDPECANYADAKIGSTSAVGCFAHGAGPYGVEELSGNVWEWTRSLWAENPYPSAKVQLAQREDLKAGPNSARVLRGGSYFDVAGFVRCASRFRLNPFYRGDFIGFRVVASPFTSGL